MARAIPLRDPNGVIVKWFGTTTDIHDLKQAEEALRERERLLQDVIDGSPSPIFLKDREGRFITINKSLERMLGMTREEIEGKTDDDIAPGEVADYWRIHDKTVMATGKAIQIEEVADLRDGHHVFLANKFPLVDADGQVYGVGAISHDITERKDAEKAAVENAAKLEAVNKELENYSYTVSHDLRTPLRAIDGYSRMILTKQGDRFDEETRRQFQVIRENTQIIEKRINDLLVFSRLGRQDISRVQLNMEALVRDLWSELLAANPGRDLTLKIGDLPATRADRALIRQVLGNLLGNAVKFTKTRDAALIEVGSYIMNIGTVYFVKDNGIGFDMKYYDKLFGVFQRLPNAEGFEGTGIDLALAQRIIHKHGGQVWAEGKVGEGATFYFTLPV